MRSKLNRKLDAALCRIEEAKDLLHRISVEAMPGISKLPDTEWRRGLHWQAAAAKQQADALYVAALELKRPLWNATEKSL